MEFAPDEVTRPRRGRAADRRRCRRRTTTRRRRSQARRAKPAPHSERPSRTAPPPRRRRAGEAAPASPAAAAPPPRAHRPTSRLRRRSPRSRGGHTRRSRATPPPSTEPPPPAVPPHVTLHVWEPEKATRFDAEEAIESAMGEVLAADPRLHFRALRTLLSPPEVADQALAAADKALADAKQAYARWISTRPGRSSRRRSRATRSTCPSWRRARVGDADARRLRLLANVRFFEGNADGAQGRAPLCLRARRVGPLEHHDVPPQMKKLVVEARLLYETLGTGRLAIDSDPQGASVWLNGIKLPDRTPTQPIDAPNGPNFISFRAGAGRRRRRRSWSPAAASDRTRWRRCRAPAQPAGAHRPGARRHR